MRATLVSSLDELSDHEERWEDLRKECGGTIYASYALTRLWLSTYQRYASPRIVLVEEGEDLVGVAPLAMTQHRLGGIPMRTLTLVGELQEKVRLSTTAPMVRPGTKGVMKNILNEVKHMDWNLFTAINMVGTDAVSSFLDGVRSVWSSVDFPPGRMLTMSIPSTGEVSGAFDKKARKNLNYRRNLLAREGHHHELRILGPAETDRAVGDFVRMHIERWSTKGGSLFRRPENVEFLRRAVQTMHDRKQGLVYELLIDGDVAAQEFEILEGDTAYGFKLSMNNAYSRYSPGWLLMDGLYQDLRSRRISKSNLGIGGEAYKYELGGVETPLVGIRATRGAASLLTGLARSSTLQFIDSKLGLSKRALRPMSGEV